MWTLCNRFLVALVRIWRVWRGFVSLAIRSIPCYHPTIPIKVATISIKFLSKWTSQRFWSISININLYQNWTRTRFSKSRNQFCFPYQPGGQSTAKLATIFRASFLFFWLFLGHRSSGSSRWLFEHTSLQLVDTWSECTIEIGGRDWYTDEAPLNDGCSLGAGQWPLQRRPRSSTSLLGSTSPSSIPGSSASLVLLMLPRSVNLTPPKPPTSLHCSDILTM